MADERDPKVSQRYRELGAEEPSRRVDEAILAASRRAASARPAPLVAPTGRRRWYFPVAAAAVIVLAAGVAVHVERDMPDPEVAVLMKQQAPEPHSRADVLARQEQEMRAPAAAAQVPAGKKVVEPKAPAAESPSEKSPIDMGIRRDEAARAPAAAAPDSAAKRFAYAPDPTREVPPEVKQEQQAQDRVVAQAQRADEEARDRRARASEPMVAAKPKPSAQPSLEIGAASGALLGLRALQDQPPEKWLETIAELRKVGNHDEADKLLEEFRKRYPDHKIPESALKK